MSDKEPVLITVMCVVRQVTGVNNSDVCCQTRNNINDNDVCCQPGLLVLVTVKYFFRELVLQWFWCVLSGKEPVLITVICFFQTKNQKENLCLDNNEYLFLGPEKLTVKDCNYEPETQVWNQMKKAGVNIVNGFLDRKLAVCFVWIENNWTIAKKTKQERKAMFKV